MLDTFYGRVPRNRPPAKLADALLCGLSAASSPLARAPARRRARRRRACAAPAGATSATSSRSPGPLDGAYVYDLTAKQALFSERADDAAPAGLGGEALHRHDRAGAHGPDRAPGTTVLGSRPPRRRAASGKATCTCAAAATRRSARAPSSTPTTAASAPRSRRSSPSSCAPTASTASPARSRATSPTSTRCAASPPATTRPTRSSKGRCQRARLQPRRERARTAAAHAPAAYAAHELLGGAEGRRRERSPGAAARRTTPAGRDAQLAQVQSPTVTQLLGLMLPPSDNFFAETLVKDLGARFGGAGTTAAGRGGRARRRSARCSAPPRMSSTARGSPKRTTPRPTRSPTCSSSSPRRPIGPVLRDNMAVAGQHRHALRTDARHRRRRPLPGQDRHAHRRLEPRRLLPARRRPPARVRDLHRRHRDRDAHTSSRTT